MSERIFSREPVTLLPFTQSEALIVVLDGSSRRIVQVSGNCRTWLDAKPAGVLGCQLSEVGLGVPVSEAVNRLISRALACGNSEIAPLFAPRADATALRKLQAPWKYSDWWVTLDLNSDPEPNAEELPGERAAASISCPRKSVTTLPRFGLVQSSVHVGMHVVWHGAGHGRQLVICEVEPWREEQDDDGGPSWIESDEEAARIDFCTTEEEVLDEVARRARALLGHSRVVACRVIASDHLEVLGEARDEALEPESFLGQRFPASDFTGEARAQTLLRGAVRGINDCSSAGVPLEPCTVDGFLTDMGEVANRIHSSVYCRYLRNMSVRSSLVAPMVVRGRLYGFLSCRDTSQRVIAGTPLRKAHLARLSRLTAMKVADMRFERDAALARRLAAALPTRLESMSAAADAVAGAAEALMEMHGADAILVVQKPNPACEGDRNRGVAESAARKESAGVEARARGEESCRRFGAAVHEDFVLEAAAELVAKRGLAQPQLRGTAQICSTTSLQQDTPLTWARWEGRDKWRIGEVECKGEPFEHSMAGLAVIPCFLFDIVVVRLAQPVNDACAGAPVFRHREGAQHKAATHQSGSSPQGPTDGGPAMLLSCKAFADFKEVAADASEEWSVAQVASLKGLQAMLHMALRPVIAEVSEQAEKAARSRTFLANMSHELRTPFNGIVGMLEVLAQDITLSEEGQESVAVASRSAESMLNILDDILTLSKLDEGKLRIAYAPFNGQRVLSDVRRLFAGLASARGIDIAVSKPDTGNTGALVVADGGRVRQILLNLVSNATKFVPERQNGKVTIALGVLDSINTVGALLEASVSAHEGCTMPPCALVNKLRAASAAAAAAVASVAWAKGAPRYLVLTVEDTGIGIPEDDLRTKLFQRFEQVESGPIKRYQGTGLGLSICVELCKLMHGAMWCASTPGKGTAFFAVLPTKVAVVRKLRNGPERDDENGLNERLNERLDTTENKNCEFDEELWTISASTASAEAKASSNLSSSASAGAGRCGAGQSTKRGGLGDAAAYEVGYETSTFRQLAAPHLGGLARLEAPLESVAQRLSITNGAAIHRAIKNGTSVVVAADDNEVNRIVLSKLLKKAFPNAEVCIVDSGTALVSLVTRLAGMRTTVPVVGVLTDYHMPGIDGIEAGRLAKEVYDELNIWLYTADMCDELVIRAATQRFRGVLRKPVTVKQIRSALSTTQYGTPNDK